MEKRVAEVVIFHSTEWTNQVVINQLLSAKPPTSSHHQPVQVYDLWMVATTAIVLVAEESGVRVELVEVAEVGVL